MNHILGICIPTYNREILLMNNLHSLIPQFMQFNLPIYISDNCSEDNTNKRVEELIKLYPHVYLKRNNSNLGMYLNIISAIKMAKTEYIWLMGDDDEIQENAVSVILEYLKEKPDFLVLNAKPHDSSLQAKRLKKIVPCQTDLFYPPFSHRDLLVMLKNRAFHGYMSSMIIRKDLFDPLLPTFEDPSFELFGNIWLPLILFYRAIENRRGIFVCKPLINNRENPRSTGENYYEHSHLDYLNAIFFLHSYGYDIVTLKRATHRGIFFTITFLIIVKSNEDLDWLVLTNEGPQKIASFFEQILMNILNITPIWLIKILSKIILKFKQYT